MIYINVYNVFFIKIKQTPLVVQSFWSYYGTKHNVTTFNFFFLNIILTKSIYNDSIYINLSHIHNPHI